MKRITLFSFLLIPAMSLLAQAPTEGLAGYWPFNGNANDESGNNHHGTVNGATLTEDRYGNPNSAYSFDGTNDRIYIGNNLIVSGSSLSISLWYKSDQTGNMISTGNRNTYRIAKSYPDSLKGTLYLSDASDGHGSNTDLVYADPADWHHVVMTYDGAQHILYVDGEVASSKSADGNVYSNQTVYLNFGVYQYFGSSFGGWFNGIIDEVRFYETVLSPEVVSGIYRAGTCSDTIISDTTVYYVSSATFEMTSPKVYLESTDSLSQMAGGCDSIIQHYARYEFSAVHCTDTLWTHDTIRYQDTIWYQDTILVHDTITTEVMDTTFITVTDSVSVTDTLIIDVELTETQPPENLNILKVYPNPARDHLFISTGDYSRMNGYLLRIINQAGSAVFETNVEEPVYRVDLSTWTGKGLYYIEVIDSQGTKKAVRKIVLQ